MQDKRFLTKKITRAGLIASLYTVTSFVVAPIASGAVQIRVSEALTLLALIFPEAVPALFVGCFLSNLIIGCAIYDVVLGSLITLVASIFTLLVGKKTERISLKIFVGGLFPVLLNAFLLPLVWLLCYGTGEYVYLVQVVLLILGQTLSVYGVGIPLLFGVRKGSITNSN